LVVDAIAVVHALGFESLRALRDRVAVRIEPWKRLLLEDRDLGVGTRREAEKKRDGEEGREGLAEPGAESHGRFSGRSIARANVEM
jgi:hypothetical protein